MGRTNRKTLEQFKQEATKYWRGRYSYDNIKEYKNNKTPMPITCPIHGDFMMNANNHLNGEGCKECRKQLMHDLLSLSIEEFINRAKEIHGNKYDYSETKYINSNIKVKIKCCKHGAFYQLPFNHLNGHSCDKCAREIASNDKRLTREEIINKFKEVHGDKYDYNEVEYKAYNIPVRIKCKEHGIFFQRPYAHINGQGCPQCKQSLLEKQVMNKLIENNIEFERFKIFDWLKDKKQLNLDFYLPQYKIGIECQGIQHFKPIDYFGGEKSFVNQLQRDKIKLELCEQNDVKLIYFSNLNIEYPYKVIENIDELIFMIKRGAEQ